YFITFGDLFGDSLMTAHMVGSRATAIIAAVVL
ncbi:hypothetical protein PSYJA_47283, partial [Pseudomonas syringae pv. japonica str. M301072]